MLFNDTFTEYCNVSQIMVRTCVVRGIIHVEYKEDIYF